MFSYLTCKDCYGLEIIKVLVQKAFPTLKAVMLTRASERPMKPMQIIGAPAVYGKLGGPRCIRKKNDLARDFGIYYSH